MFMRSAAAVPPRAEHLADPLYGVVNRVPSEDAPGHRQLVDVAELVEGGEAAEQVGVGGDVGPDRAVDPARPGPFELRCAGADQPSPVLIRPPPEGAVVLGAAQQHQADRIGDRALVVPRVRTPQRDRKSTRLNSSHVKNSYAVFCLKKKKRVCALYHVYIRSESLVGVTP